MPPIEAYEIPLPPPLVLSSPAVYVESMRPALELPYEDGENLESNWHRLQISLLVDIIEWHRHGQTDFFVGGNMFIHFSEAQVRNKDFRGPDFFLVNDVSHRQDRLYWAIWEEGGRYPDLIVELMSPTTRDVDLTVKFQVYEKTFATREYVAYDPETSEIKAWRKNARGKFQPIAPSKHGHVYLESAELWLGKLISQNDDEKNMTWLRFFDESGKLIPTGKEKEAERADAEEARAKAESGRADAADARAEAEKARADALAAEVARLKAQFPNPS
jgi:Uma2 family endonuclease